MSAVESTLTPDEAEQIAATRELLKALEKRLGDAAYAEDGRVAFNLDKLAETVDVAEEALFNVLNTAHAYQHCPAATDALAPKRRVPA